MRAYVSPTDGRWAAFLRARPYLDEVNFWWPSGVSFKALLPGERFLFKAKAVTVVGSSAAASSAATSGCR